MNIAPSLTHSLEKTAVKGGMQDQSQIPESAFTISPQTTAIEHPLFEKHLNPFLSSPKQVPETEGNGHESPSPTEAELADVSPQTTPRIIPTDSHPLPHYSFNAASSESSTDSSLLENSNQTESFHPSPSATKQINAGPTRASITPHQVAVSADTPSAVSPNQPVPANKKPETQAQTRPASSAIDKASPPLERDLEPRLTSKTGSVQTERAVASPPQRENPAAIESPTGQELLTRDLRSQWSLSNKHPETQQNGGKTPIKEAEIRPGIPPAQGQGERLDSAPKTRVNSKMETKAQRSNQPSLQVAQTQNASQAGLVSTSAMGSQINLPSELSGLDSNPIQSLSPNPSTLNQSPESILSGKPVVPSSILSNVEQVQNLIKEQAIILKRFNQDSLTAEIRPDPKTSITLSLQTTSDGITVTAMLDPKNSEWLKSNWNSLQSKLAEQNITLEEPISQDRSSSQSSFSNEKGGRDNEAWNLDQRKPNSLLNQERNEASGSPHLATSTPSTELSTEKVYWA